MSFRTSIYRSLTSSSAHLQAALGGAKSTTSSNTSLYCQKAFKIYLKLIAGGSVAGFAYGSYTKANEVMRWQRTLPGAVTYGARAFSSGGLEGAATGAALVAGFPLSISLIISHKIRIENAMQKPVDLNKASPTHDKTCEPDDVDNDSEAD